MHTHVRMAWLFSTLLRAATLQCPPCAYLLSLRSTTAASTTSALAAQASVKAIYMFMQHTYCCRPLHSLRRSDKGNMFEYKSKLKGLSCSTGSLIFIWPECLVSEHCI